MKSAVFACDHCIQTGGYAGDALCLYKQVAVSMVLASVYLSCLAARENRSNHCYTTVAKLWQAVQDAAPALTKCSCQCFALSQQCKLARSTVLMFTHEVQPIWPL